MKLLEGKTHLSPEHQKGLEEPSLINLQNKVPISPLLICQV